MLKLQNYAIIFIHFCSFRFETVSLIYKNGSMKPYMQTMKLIYMEKSARSIGGQLVLQLT